MQTNIYISVLAISLEWMRRTVVVVHSEIWSRAPYSFFVLPQYRTNYNKRTDCSSASSNFIRSATIFLRPRLHPPQKGGKRNSRTERQVHSSKHFFLRVNKERGNELSKKKRESGQRKLKCTKRNGEKDKSKSMHTQSNQKKVAVNSKDIFSTPTHALSKVFFNPLFISQLWVWVCLCARAFSYAFLSVLSFLLLFFSQKKAALVASSAKKHTGASLSNRRLCRFSPPSYSPTQRSFFFSRSPYLLSL